MIELARTRPAVAKNASPSLPMRPRLRAKKAPTAHQNQPLSRGLEQTRARASKIRSVAPKARRPRGGRADQPNRARSGRPAWRNEEPLVSPGRQRMATKTASTNSKHSFGAIEGSESPRSREKAIRRRSRGKRIETASNATQPGPVTGPERAK